MNKKGISLIIVIIMIAVSVIIIAAIVPNAARHRNMTQRIADSIRALYAAESGINRALIDLNATNWGAWSISGNTYTLPTQSLTDNSGNIVSFYDSELDMADPEFPIAESTGHSPAVGDADRTILANVARVEAAIISKGDVEQGGNATVNGEIIEYASFAFVNIFGDTVANIKADPDTEVVAILDETYNNYSPVPRPEEPYTDDNGNSQWDPGEPYTDENGNSQWDDQMKITWFDVAEGEKAKISSSTWSGGGILVVEGDIEMTGGVFNGVLYVIGNMTFGAGNTIINGTIFVDGTVENLTDISGTTVLTYDVAEILAAFGYNPMPFARDSWREIYK